MENTNELESALQLEHRREHPLSHLQWRKQLLDHLLRRHPVRMNTSRERRQRRTGAFPSRDCDRSQPDLVFLFADCESVRPRLPDLLEQLAVRAFALVGELHWSDPREKPLHLSIGAPG